MGINIKYLLVGIILTLTSCFILKDDVLVLQKKQNIGMDIKLNGYWWYWLDDGRKAINTYFFYGDGIVLYGTAKEKTKIRQLEKDFVNGSFAIDAKKSKTGWGLFETESNKIKFETWEPSSGGGLSTVIRSGEILDKETFIITSVLSNYDHKTYARRDTYHFQYLMPKPDSTNTFIK
jgi:hypothetical protein